MNKQEYSVTLIELLIAITLLSVIILGFSSIDLFSRFHLRTAQRRSDIQNEISYVLEHMAKEIARAIGDANQLPVTIETAGGPNPAWMRIRAWIDSNRNGIRDTNDIETAYQWNRGGSQFRYWPDYAGPNQVISNRVVDFNINQRDNYVEVNISACWDPDGAPDACGTLDNPQITMRARINMPSVSVN